MDYILVYSFGLNYFEKVVDLDCFECEIVGGYTRKFILSCTLFRCVWFDLNMRIVSIGFCRNLQWYCIKCHQWRTGWKWDSSGFSKRYSFSGLNFVIIWIWINGSWFCLRLEVSSSNLVWFLSNTFFSDCWLILTYTVNIVINRSICSDCFCNHIR